MLDVLRGDGNAPSTAAVVLNAAAAIYVSGQRLEDATVDSGVTIGRALEAAIDSAAPRVC